MSIADNLAGLELNRLRWERDKDMGRPQLTYNGDPAIVPPRLSEKERTAVSFLLEEDRARAFKLRCPVVNAQGVLTRHLVTGGAPYNALRLDYLVAWAQPGGTDRPPPAHGRDRGIRAHAWSPHSRARCRTRFIRRSSGVERTKGPRTGPVDPDRYQSLVLEELRYKSDVLDGTIEQLATFGASTLLPAYEAIEACAQAVWRRRLSLRASDLVRFGRTYRSWRNNLVPQIEHDGKCRDQLLALANPHRRPRHGGRRRHPRPLLRDGRLVRSRGPGHGVPANCRRVASRAAAHARRACVEDPNVAVKIQAGSFRLSGLSIGPLDKDGLPDDTPDTVWRWKPDTHPQLEVGDRVIVGDFGWFSENRGNNFLNVNRPSMDNDFGPKPACDDDSYDGDPEGHKWCCRPHASSRPSSRTTRPSQRAAGLLNPEVWPPVRDDDGFEVLAKGLPTGRPVRQSLDRSSRRPHHRRPGRDPVSVEFRISGSTDRRRQVPQ